jgi:hypothetical protein
MTAFGGRGGCYKNMPRPKSCLDKITWTRALWRFFYVSLTVHPCTVFFKWSQLGAHYFLIYLFQFLYMFRATMCPSSEELTVCMWHWYFSLCTGGCLVCTTSWYISFNFCACFGQLCAHHQKKLLYVCDTGIFRSVRVAVWSALLLSIFISTSVHVSGNYVPIIRRTYCIYATPVFFTL